MVQEFSELFKLGVSEKLQLVEDLWDNIASVPESVPIPAWQKDELAKRKSEYLKNPDLGISWEKAKKRIRNVNLDWEKNFSDV